MSKKTREEKKIEEEKKRCSFDDPCLAEVNYMDRDVPKGSVYTASKNIKGNNKFTLSFKYGEKDWMNKKYIGIDLFLARSPLPSMSMGDENNIYRSKVKKREDHFTKVREYNKKLAEFFNKNEVQKALLEKIIQKGDMIKATYKIGKVEYLKSDVVASPGSLECTQQLCKRSTVYGWDWKKCAQCTDP